MALNPNHVFEDLGEIKCAIVEKNCSQLRVDFLTKLLEHNGFTVVVAKTPPPKAAKPAPAKPAAKPAAGAETTPAKAEPEAPAAPAGPPPPDTFTLGVTDLTFSPINAVFNRELKTLDGKIVTSKVWKQQEEVPQEDEWYWRK